MPSAGTENPDGPSASPWLSLPETPFRSHGGDSVQPGAHLLVVRWVWGRSTASDQPARGCG
jgi:hypothetical protein